MLTSLDALGADLGAGTVGKGCPLEIGLLAALNRRIVFGGTNAVGITSSHAALLVANWANFHDSEHNAIIVYLLCKL